MEGLRPPEANRGGAFERWSVRLLLPAMALALVLLVMSLFGFRLSDLPALTEGPTRGDWRIQSLAGRNLAGFPYMIRIENGAIVGGYDGCNNWGFTDEVDERTGQPTVVSDAQGCNAGPADAAYWQLVQPGAELTMLGDGDLEVRADSVVARFTRGRGLERGAADFIDPSAPPFVPPPPPPPPPTQRIDPPAPTA